MDGRPLHPSEEQNSIGIWLTGAIVVGTMIGSGIFMLPVSLAPLGANVIAGWILSSSGAMCIAFALARLSRLGGNGIQANVEHQLGPASGFVVAWAFWVSSWSAQAAVAIAGASALSFVSPVMSGDVFVMSVAIASVVFFTGLNGLGVRVSGIASVITIAIRLVPLAGVILVLALRWLQTKHLEPLAPSPSTVENLASATALTFFALTGFENATTPVGKVRDPSRTIPRAIIGGTLFVAVVYLFASTAVQLLLPARIVARSPAPFAEVIGAQWGGGAASLMAVCIAVAAFGCLNALILGTGELGYAMGLRRDLPAVMARTVRGNTPVAAQIVGSALSIFLILANSSRGGASLFKFIILLSTSAALVLYLAGALAAWRLVASTRAKAVLLGAFLFIAFALYGSGFDADAWCLVLLAIGLTLRAVLHRVNAARDARTALLAPSE